MEFEFRPDREAHLRILCEEMGRSVDDFVNEAVLTFMEDYGTVGTRRRRGLNI